MMRMVRAFSVALIALALKPLFAQDAAQSGFEGTWLRDEVIGKKGPLPRITWTIKFDDKVIALTETSESGSPTRTPTYNLDGSEASYRIRNLPPNRTKLVVRKDRLIQISEVMPSQDGNSMNISETWELLNRNTTLKVTRKFQISGPEGPLPIGLAGQVYSFSRVPSLDKARQ